MRILKNHWQKLAVGICLTFLLLAFLAFTFSAHIWFRHTEFTITRNGHILVDSRVYLSQTGTWLIKVADDGWHTFYPKTGGMGVCHNLKRHIQLPQWLILQNLPGEMPCVNFSPVKVQEPHLTIQTDYIEFTSLSNEIVRVGWKRTS